MLTTDNQLPPEAREIVHIDDDKLLKLMKRAAYVADEPLRHYLPRILKERAETDLKANNQPKANES